jgi:hypothetical protein
MHTASGKQTREREQEVIALGVREIMRAAGLVE